MVCAAGIASGDFDSISVFSVGSDEDLSPLLLGLVDIREVADREISKLRPQR